MCYDLSFLAKLAAIVEHRKVEKWTKKVPYFIHQKKEDLFFLPGLYSVSELPNKETGELEKRWPVYTIRTSKERPDGKQKNKSYTWENLPELKFFL